jgi:hypothetical protein
LFLICLALFLPATFTRAQPGFISETATELSTTGDFDGDGREEIAIVEKATGAYRIGYQLAPGAYTWASPRASGVRNVTGFAVGHFLQLDRDALAFTSPEANRVNLFDATSPGSAGLPISVFIPSLGPNQAVPLDIASIGAGLGGCVANEAHDDLFVTSVLNGGSPTRFTTVRNNGASQCSLFEDVLPPQPARGNRVVLKVGQPAIAALLFRGVGSDTFRAYDLSGVGLAPSLALAAAGLPSGADYVTGNFDGSAYNHFLFYVPATTLLFVRQVQELDPPVPGRYQFSTASGTTLSEAARQMFALPGADATKLLIIFGNGETGRVYNFNGAGPLTLVQEFTAASGEHFTGAAALPNNGFMAFSGAAGSASSASFKVWNFSGGAYVAGAAGALPSMNALSSAANVFQFKNTPFVDQDPPPTLLRSLNAGDWTSGFSLGIGVPRPLTVTLETFIDSAHGLDNPTPLALGPAHLDTSSVLVNQYMDFISLFGFAPALGDEVSEVSIAPAPGQYKTSVTISFKPSNAGDEVWFRFGAVGNWRRYAEPTNIFDTTTVYYYARPPGGSLSKSSIRSASYTFTEGPGTRDSDGDGVPDYVEIAKGLDPVNSGDDADDDGYSDLEELLAGTNPADATSTPDAATNPRGFEQRGAFNLALTPFPWDGTSNTTSLCLTGPVLRVFDAHGSLLSLAVVTNDEPAGPEAPAATLTNVTFDSQQRFVVAATELHYDILTTNLDTKIGRELLGLTPVPPLAKITVPYVYGYADLDTEKNNWIHSAQAAYRVSRETIFRELTVHDSLAALLVERKIAEMLRSRGATWWDNITLFPFRPADAARTNPPRALLLELESHGDTNKPPALSLLTTFNTISNAVHSTDPPIKTLARLTRELYRISSACNNTSPGTYASPIDVLRAFIATGALDANYLARTTLSAELIADAFLGASNVLALVPTRPVTNLVLFVGTDSFSDACTVLTNLALPQTPRSLFDAAGRPFRFPDAFNVLAGSLVQVCGYTDVAAAGCAGDPMEVISASLVSVPVASSPDGDGNLLPDDWERAFFGNGADAFADDDGDGYQNLQEMFEGTDPRDAASTSGSGPAAMSRPEIIVTVLGDGSVRLQWSFAMRFAGLLRFDVRSAAAVTGPFTNMLTNVPHAGGAFDVTLPPPLTPNHFYYVTISLPAP